MFPPLSSPLATYMYVNSDTKYLDLNTQAYPITPHPPWAMEVIYLDTREQKTYQDHSDLLNQARVTQNKLRNFPRKIEETCGLPMDHYFFFLIYSFLNIKAKLFPS